MGKLSLLLVIAALFTSGLVFYNVQGNTLRADQRVWDQQQHVLARDAASTGLSVAVRRLADNLNGNWQTVATALQQTDVAHNGGTYSVAATTGTDCSALPSADVTTALASYGVTNAARDVIQITSTGSYASAGGTPRRHQIVACYLQADWNDPMPPSFLYSFISNNTFTFNGGIEVTSIANLDGYGNIHSNNNMVLGPQVTIQGHATMSSLTGNSVHQNTSVVSFGQGPSVPMTAFDPNVFRTQNNIPASGQPSLTNGTFRYDGGNVSLSGNVTIRDPDMPADHNVNTPYIWFVNGDLTISNNAHLTLPDHTIIMVTGTINIGGSASVTVTGTEPPNNANSTQFNAWVNQQLHEGRPPIAWYGNGNVTLGGQGSVVGNFYTNGNFTLNGGGQGGNLVGSVAALGTVTGHGGGQGTNFVYAQVGQQNVIPGVLLPGKQIVRLALAEWTGPVLDNL